MPDDFDMGLPSNVQDVTIVAPPAPKAEAPAAPQPIRRRREQEEDKTPQAPEIKQEIDLVGLLGEDPAEPKVEAAPAPKAEPKVEVAAPKVEYAARDKQRAYEHGWTEDQYAGLTSDALKTALDMADQAALRAFRAAQKSPVQTEPEKKQPEPELDFTADMKDEDGTPFHPKLVGTVKKLQDHFKTELTKRDAENNELKGYVKQLVEFERQRQVQEQTRLVDEEFKGLDTKYDGLLGSKTFAELQQEERDLGTPRSLARRRAIDVMAGYEIQAEKARGRTLTASDARARVADALFGRDDPITTEAKPAAPARDLPPRDESTGRFQPTTTARAQGRHPVAPTGEKGALANIAEKLGVPVGPEDAEARESLL